MHNGDIDGSGEVAIRLTVQPEKSWMTETTGFQTDIAASCRQRTGGRWMLAGVRYEPAWARKFHI